MTSAGMIALVPVKGLGAAKSRLADSMTAADRAALVLDMLGHVLDTIAASKAAERMIVLTADAEVAVFARARGASVLFDPPACDLNAALEHAVAALTGNAIMILPADLPRIEAADIAELASRYATAGGVIIAPSQDGGTNALCMPLPTPIAFGFGIDSAARHAASAVAVGLPAALVNNVRIAFDVDRATDLRRLEDQPRRNRYVA